MNTKCFSCPSYVGLSPEIVERKKQFVNRIGEKLKENFGIELKMISTVEELKKARNAVGAIRMPSKECLDCDSFRFNSKKS